MNFNNPFGYVLLVFLLMCQYLGVELGKLIFVPFETLHLTKLFYKYGPLNKKIVLPAKHKRNWIDYLPDERLC